MRLEDILSRCASLTERDAKAVQHYILHGTYPEQQKFSLGILVLVVYIFCEANAPTPPVHPLVSITLVACLAAFLLICYWRWRVYISFSHRHIGNRWGGERAERAIDVCLAATMVNVASVLLERIWPNATVVKEIALLAVVAGGLWAVGVMVGTRVKAKKVKPDEPV